MKPYVPGLDMVLQILDQDSGLRILGDSGSDGQKCSERIGDGFGVRRLPC